MINNVINFNNNQVTTMEKTTIEKINDLKEKAMIYRKVSEKYGLIESESLIKTIESTLTANGLDFEKKFAFRKGVKTTNHFITYKILNYDLNINGDLVKPMICFNNSFNGETSFKFNLGFFRMVCSNGLMVGEKLFSEKIIHIKGLTLETKLQVLMLKLTDAICYIKGKLINDVTNYLSLDLTESQEMKVIDGLQEKHILSKRLAEKVKYYRQTANLPILRQADQARNIWCLYNVINEVIRKASRSDAKNLEKNVKLMDQVVNFAKAA